MSTTTTARVVAADNGRPPIGDWEQITARAPRLAATVDAYLGELAETRSPATVHAVSATLRQFAGYVSLVDPSCTTAAGITGHHVGDYCLWLALHPDRRTRRTITAGGIDRRIGELRRFFEHLSERRHADAPVLVPVPARRRRSRAPARVSSTALGRRRSDRPPSPVGARLPSGRRSWRRRGAAWSGRI
jgi:site-specific recombinase XerD